MLRQLRNIHRLNKRIDKLKFNGKVVVVFDFDELITPENLTKKVTRSISMEVNDTLISKLGYCSFDGLYYLNNLMSGLNYASYCAIRNKIVSETPMTEGFAELFKTLMEKYTVIIISSGMKDICEAKLKEVNFPSENVLGNEFKIKRGKIVDSDIIISDELKGYIVRKLRKSRFVIAVGQSSGDKMLIRDSNVGMAFNSTTPNLAKFNPSNAKELEQMINSSARQFHNTIKA